MKRPVFRPDDFECTLVECPPGFFLRGEVIGYKSEYRHNDGFLEAFNSGGEYYWAEAKTKEEREQLKVIPLTYSWEEE